MVEGSRVASKKEKGRKRRKMGEKEEKTKKGGETKKQKREVERVVGLPLLPTTVRLQIKTLRGFSSKFEDWWVSIWSPTLAGTSAIARLLATLRKRGKREKIIGREEVRKNPHMRGRGCVGSKGSSRRF